MTEPRFFIRHGKLRCNLPWETVTGGGRFAVERMFNAVEAEFCSRVALKVVNQCFRWPYLLALPPLEVGTKARLDRLYALVCDIADVIPSKGVFPFTDADGVAIPPVVEEFIPAPPYPGIKPGGLAERAFRAADETRAPLRTDRAS